MPKAQTTPGKMDRGEDINPENFCTAKETINNLKGQATEWKKIFASHLSHKRLTARIDAELLNSVAIKQLN